MNREVGDKMKAGKEQCTGENCKNIEKGTISGNSKEAYNTLKALRKTQQYQSAVIGESRGNILTESTVFLNQWTEYCSGLYNYELHQNTSLFQRNQTHYTRG